MTQHDWRADSAARAGNLFQSHLDSIAAALEAMRETQQRHIEDSLRADWARREAANVRADSVANTKLGPWRDCVIAWWNKPDAQSVAYFTTPCRPLFPGRRFATDDYVLRIKRDLSYPEQGAIDAALSYQLDSLRPH